jgi:hypothetical protein
MGATETTTRLELDYLAREVLRAFMQGEPMPLRANEIRERVAHLGLSSGELRALLLNMPDKFFQEERRWQPCTARRTNIRLCWRMRSASFARWARPCPAQR